MATTERTRRGTPAWPVLIIAIAAVAGGVLSIVMATRQATEGVVQAVPLAFGIVLIVLTAATAALGFYVVQPNQSVVLVRLGRYLGTVRSPGWYWTLPLPVVIRIHVSLRIRNFESDNLKVNDAVGNPVEIGAVIVWRVVNTAEAVFDVDDYVQFVKIQTETAIRHVASQYPYDTYEGDELSLRENRDEVAASLQGELTQHLGEVGVEVMDTRLRQLSYAPEIAADMLRRQQANAVVAARRRIVEGAVGMVEDALERLESQHVVELDDEKKAAMVSNLLVVLTSEHHAQPVLNTGTLHQ